MDLYIKAIGFPHTRRMFSTNRDLHSSSMWSKLAADEVILRIHNDSYVGYIQIPINQREYVIDRMMILDIDPGHFTIRMVHFPPLQ